MAVGSVPPDWYGDDFMTVTLLDVLQKRADEMKRRR